MGLPKKLSRVSETWNCCKPRVSTKQMLPFVDLSVAPKLLLDFHVPKLALLSDFGGFPKSLPKTSLPKGLHTPTSFTVPHPPRFDDLQPQQTTLKRWKLGICLPGRGNYMFSLANLGAIGVVGILQTPWDWKRVIPKFLESRFVMECADGIWMNMNGSLLWTLAHRNSQGIYSQTYKPTNYGEATFEDLVPTLNDPLRHD